MKTPIIIRIRDIINRFFKKFSDWRPIKEGASENAEYIEHAAFKPAIMLCDSDKAVGTDGAVDLYPDRVFRVAPECLDVKMLLDPLEKQFDLPSFLVEKRDVLSLKVKGVGDVYECPFKFSGVVNNPAKKRRVFLFGLIAGKSDGLVTNNTTVAVDKFLSVNDFVVESTLLSNDEERINKIDSKKPFKVKIASVENVVCARFIRDVIHCIAVMDICIGDVDVCWNLRDNIEQSMQLDAALCGAEPCPPEKVETKVNGGAVKCIKLSMQFKWCFNSFVLSNINEFLRKFLKYLPVSIDVCLSKVRQLYRLLSESKVISFLRMGINHTYEFPKAFTTIQLAEHHHQKLVPTRELLDVAVSSVLGNKSLKVFLREQLYQLGKYIFSFMHIDSVLMSVKDTKSNRGHDIFAYNVLNTNNLNRPLNYV